MSTARPAASRGRTARVCVALLLAAVALALTALGGRGLVEHDRAQATLDALPVDLVGNRVRLDPGATPSAAEVAEMRVSHDDGQRFQVPSVGLDVPLGSLDAVRDVIVPPTFTAAYTVRNRGVDPAHADDGTVYVVMHSLHGGVAPGNALFDVGTGTSRVAPGAEIEVAGVTYTVRSSRFVAKTDLPSDADVWLDEPGRLVVLTCLQRERGPSIKNMVVVATRSR